jgi:hypothetical protein
MAKTVFSSGVIVTSEWLNGARSLTFDGADLDWHYNPLGLSSLVTAGPDGLDSRYLTLFTNQPNLVGDILVSGQPVSGDKVVTGKWTFGLDSTLNPDVSQELGNSPRSFITNLKYENANGIENPSVYQKFSSLADQDLVTKKIVKDSLDNLEIDNGIY